MIDVERLVYLYLTGQPSVDAEINGQLPAKTTGQWITLRQLDARAVGDHRSDHVVDYLLQCDIYAPDQPSVWTLALATRAALKNMPEASHDDAVVTGVIFAGMARIPDTDFKPVKERVSLTVNVTAHPA